MDRKLRNYIMNKSIRHDKLTSLLRFFKVSVDLISGPENVVDIQVCSCVIHKPINFDHIYTI